jgi:hypothetical protein
VGSSIRHGPALHRYSFRANVTIDALRFFKKIMKVFIERVIPKELMGKYRFLVSFSSLPGNEGIAYT